MIVHGEVMAERTPRRPTGMTDKQWVMTEPLLLAPPLGRTIEASEADGRTSGQAEWFRAAFT